MMLQHALRQIYSLSKYLLFVRSSKQWRALPHKTLLRDSQHFPTTLSSLHGRGYPQHPPSHTFSLTRIFEDRSFLCIEYDTDLFPWRRKVFLQQCRRDTPCSVLCCVRLIHQLQVHIHKRQLCCDIMCM